MIEKVLLRDCDDKEAPPGRVLEVGLVGYQLFLTVSEFSETNREVKATKLQEICVDARSLSQAILALSRAQEYEVGTKVDSLIQAVKDAKNAEK